MVGPRSAGRRSRRSARRACASRAGGPGALGPLRALSAEPAGSRRRHRSRRDRGWDRGRAARANMMSSAPPLLEIEGLKVVFRGDGRVTHAVDMVDLTVSHGMTLGLVGESGCGKSVTSLAVMGLVSKTSAEIEGRVRFDGVDLLALPDRDLRDLRGDRLAMIFQEPMTALNPSYTIGEQIIEAIVRHRGVSRRQGRARAPAMLRPGGGQAPRRRGGGSL